MPWCKKSGSISFVIIHTAGQCGFTEINFVKATPHRKPYKKETVYGDSGYLGAEKREDAIEKNKAGNPIRKALVKRTGKSSVACSAALSMGLYISHCFIPPTPEPIAAANTLFSSGLGAADANLLLVMGIGMLCSILPMIAGYAFALFIGRKVKAKDEPVTEETISQNYEELVACCGKLPGGLAAFAPIVIPILLMSLSSALSMIGISAELITFLGTPIISIAIGAMLAIVLLFISGKGEELHGITNEALKTVGPILFVTASGGVLGKAIASSQIVSFIESNAASLQSLGLVFPFLLAALLKTALGSLTIAITTSAGIIAPLMTILSFTTPVSASLVVVAIGAGAMTVSHANDSNFWVVTTFGEMEPQDGYKVQTLGTLVVGTAALLGVLLLSLFV